MHATCCTVVPQFRDLPHVWKCIEVGGGTKTIVWKCLHWTGQITRHATRKAAVKAYWS